MGNAFLGLGESLRTFRATINMVHAVCRVKARRDDPHH